MSVQARLSSRAPAREMSKEVLEPGDASRKEPFEDLRKTGEQIIVFNEIAKALTSTLEPQEVLQLIISQVSNVVQPTSWQLLLEEEGSDQLYFEIAVGDGSDKLVGTRTPKDAGVAGAAFQSGVPQIVPDASKLPRSTPELDALAGTRTKSVVALPLKVRDRTLGVLQLINGLEFPADRGANVVSLNGPRQLQREDLQVLKAIADYAAIAIANARNYRRLQELTIIDEHTGLYNARHLRELLGSEVARAARFRHPLSLLFIDLDNFKAINDTHGHLAGSELLRQVGEELTSTIRQVDYAFRYGGDEFAILLVETDAVGALRVGHRVIKRLVGREFLTERGLSVSVTASVGAATYPQDAKTATELLNAADQAMYRAKNSGRNAIAAAHGLGDPRRA